MKIYWRCNLGCGGSGEVELGDRIGLLDAIGLLSDAHAKVSKTCEDHNGPLDLVADIEESDAIAEGATDAAAALGRRGGLKGGKVRADKLTPERRAEIARKAANRRWGNPEETEKP